MGQILHCDWLPELARCGYLACLGLRTMSCKKITGVLYGFFEKHFRIKTSGKKRRFDLSEIIFKLKKKRMKYTYISTN